MKKLWILLLVLLCTGCSALPAEERSFAVALGVEQSGSVWQVSARVPTYQTSGGYMTLKADGTSLAEALALLDATSPMMMHLGQLRMVVFSRGLAESSDFVGALSALSDRHDFRQHALVCATEDTVAELIDKLEPATGSRLSKSLDVMIEARTEQGVIPPATVANILRMGERQGVVLACIALEDTANVARPGLNQPAGMQAASGAGKVQMGGGWLMNAQQIVRGQVTVGEMQLLALMSGSLRKGTLVLQEDTITLLDAMADIAMKEGVAHCAISLRYTGSSMTEEGVRQSLSMACQGVLGKLAAADCDALGLGRRAIIGMPDMAQWHALDWSSRYPMLEWRVTVEAQRAV